MSVGPVFNKMICYPPSQRITAKAALEHPWFDEVREDCRRTIRQSAERQRQKDAAEAQAKRRRGREGASGGSGTRPSEPMDCG